MNIEQMEMLKFVLCEVVAVLGVVCAVICVILYRKYQRAKEKADIYADLYRSGEEDFNYALSVCKIRQEQIKELKTAIKQYEAEIEELKKRG